MPGIKSPKLDSGRLLLLTAGAAAISAQAAAPNTDTIHVMGGALATSQGHVSSPSTVAAMQKHPEWHWLPGYKWAGLTKHPYSYADRAWEVMSGEVGPILSIFALHQLSTHIGLQNLENSEAIADYVWRLGEAVGDYATSDSSSELLWRLFASNIDKIHTPEFAHSGRLNQHLFWMAKRTLAYVPMLKNTLPDAMRQYVLQSVGFAGIAFETAALNEHFALTFVSSKSASVDDPARPNSAYLDLDFIKRSRPYTEPRGRFESALVELEKASYEHNLTRIRFYPVALNDPRKGTATLTLFVRPYFNDQHGPLVRFPVEFGSGHTWWTEAMDKGMLQGIYNDDQYTVVRWINELGGYDQKNLANPLSDRILEKLPAVVSWAATQSPASDYELTFEAQIQTALEPPLPITGDGSDNLGLPGKPRQSMYHTAINAGDESFLFIDDYFSQRTDLPILTMITRKSYNSIKPDTLQNLETHLPWQEYRGGDKIASTLLKGQAYGWLVKRLMKARTEELDERQQESQKYRDIGVDQQVADGLSALERELVPAGKTLDSYCDEQKALVQNQHSESQKRLTALQKELEKTRGRHAASTQKYEQAEQREREVKKQLADHSEKLTQAEQELSAAAKTKLAELKKNVDIVETNKRGREKTTANRWIKDNTSTPANKKLKVVSDLLTEEHKFKAAVQQEQKVLATAKTYRDDQKTALEQKEADIRQLTRDNEEMGKLAKLELLKRLASAHGRGLTAESSEVQADLDQLKTGGVQSEWSAFKSLGEFLGTARKAIPSITRAEITGGGPPATPPSTTTSGNGASES